ncbi:hypothetical protein [Janthinobacterium psychrotolerans]|uniref:Uncharacterized protein n=1 Tax=Janthinobacterium psychrotolerans TaxID=1747903 RepID=A0A1A7BYA2_9BURK|nr:hypothetical protein [Janthinobacterium psychrotolerans]OBV37719.1 hypothetical protein ASR47_1003383 [Janthinobacterium psychrotolerans]
MKIQITGPVKRNGKVLPLDETVSMPDADAQALIDAGAAEPVGTKAKAVADGDGTKAKAVADGDGAKAKAAAGGDGDKPKTETEAETDTGTESK